MHSLSTVEVSGHHQMLASKMTAGGHVRVADWHGGKARSPAIPISVASELECTPSQTRSGRAEETNPVLELMMRFGAQRLRSRAVAGRCDGVLHESKLSRGPPRPAPHQGAGLCSWSHPSALTLKLHLKETVGTQGLSPGGYVGGWAGNVSFLICFKICLLFCISLTKDITLIREKNAFVKPSALPSLFGQ